MKLGISTLVGLLSAASVVVAQTVSPVQSPARPFGLDIAGPVMIGGSDAESSYFNDTFLPHLVDLQDVDLEGVDSLSIGDFTATRVDSNRLQITNDVDMRVYFLGETADYHNTLGFNTAGPGIDSGDPQIIFPDASLAQVLLNPAGRPIGGPDATPQRTEGNPLFAGDFVDAGFLSAGTNLDFFLIANGVNGGSNIYSTTSAINPDGLVHAATWIIADSPYLLFSFEDLFNGGDSDYNDVVFAANIGTGNIAVLAPEPGLLAILAGFLAMAGLLRRRLRGRKG